MRQSFWSAIQDAAPNCELRADSQIDNLALIRQRTRDQEGELIEVIYQQLLRQMADRISERLKEKVALTRTEGPHYLHLGGRAWVFTDKQLEAVCEAIYMQGMNDAPSHTP